MNDVKSRRLFIKQVVVVTAAAGRARLGGREVSAQAAENSGELPSDFSGAGRAGFHSGCGRAHDWSGQTEAEGIVRAVEG